jgi:hypothetical protein
MDSLRYCSKKAFLFLNLSYWSHVLLKSYHWCKSVELKWCLALITATYWCNAGMIGKHKAAHSMWSLNVRRFLCQSHLDTSWSPRNELCQASLSYTQQWFVNLHIDKYQSMVRYIALSPYTLYIHLLGQLRLGWCSAQIYNSFVCSVSLIPFCFWAAVTSAWHPAPLFYEWIWPTRTILSWSCVSILMIPPIALPYQLDRLRRVCMLLSKSDIVV